MSKLSFAYRDQSAELGPSPSVEHKVEDTSSRHRPFVAPKPPSVAVQQSSKGEVQSFWNYRRLGLASILVGAGVAWTVNANGGARGGSWYVCLLLVGCAALLSWLPRVEPLRLLEHWHIRFIGLLLAYPVLQIVPYPILLLRLLSPSRARLADLARPVTGPTYFASLSVTPTATIDYFFRLLAYVLVFFIIRELTVRTRGSRFWTPAIPVILVGLWQAVTIHIRFSSGPDLLAAYENSGHFTGLLAIALPLTVLYGISLIQGDPWRYDSRAHTYTGIGFLLGAAYMFVTIVDAQSTMAFTATWVSFLVMSAGPISVRIPARWRSIVGLALVGAIIATFVVLLPDHTAHGLRGLLAGGNTRRNLPAFRDILHLVAGYPLFGAGLGSFASLFAQYQTGVVDSSFKYAHNDYVQLVSELGIVGTILLAGWVYFALSGAIRTTRHEWPGRRLLALGCVGGIAASTVLSLSDFNLYVPANALIVVWLVAVVSGLASPSQPQTKTAPELSEDRLRPALLATASLVLLFAIPAVLFSETYRGNTAAERAFCHFGICDIDTVLAASSSGTGLAREQDLREAIRREPASPLPWAGLGDALLKSGHPKESAPMFANAYVLGPNLPPVLLQVADFYFRNGEHDRALALVSRALAQTAVYRTAAFEWCSVHAIPASRVLSTVLPNNADSHRAYLRYLLGAGDAEGASQVWEIATARGFLADDEAREYVNWLFDHKQYQSAAREWASYLGDRAQGYLETNLIFNGDFETEPSPVALDWTQSPTAGVALNRDTETRVSGASAVRIRFDGKQNVGTTGVSQRVFLEPGLYRFEAYAKALGVTTDQGISIRIDGVGDASALHVQTDPLLSTNGWERINRAFCVTPRAALIDVSVSRQPSVKIDRFVWGMYWLDAVRLSKIGSACAN